MPHRRRFCVLLSHFRPPQVHVFFDHILRRVAEDVLQAVGIPVMHDVHFGEGVPQGMWTDPHVSNAGVFPILAQSFLERPDAERPAIERDEKMLRSNVPPCLDIPNQDFTDLIAKRNVAWLFAFSDDAEYLAFLQVNLAHFQLSHFPDAQARIENQGQHGIIPETGERILVRLLQQGDDLLLCKRRNSRLMAFPCFQVCRRVVRDPAFLMKK